MSAQTPTEANPTASGVPGPQPGDDMLEAFLTPNSSIQFLDYVIDADAAGRISRRFFEDIADAGPDGEPELHAVTLDEGVFYHPVTGEIGDPARTYVVDGRKALEPFLDAWLPIPYIRAVDAGGREGVLDEGPSNWARVFISRQEGAAGDYRVVIALDTAIDADDSPAARAAAPTVADVTSGTAFHFSDAVDEIAWFATEAWVDDWIGECYRDSIQRDAGQAGSAAAAASLAHLAHYLVLLTVLKSECELPEIRFADPGAGDATGVDLVLDIGSSRTAALLHEPARGIATGGHGAAVGGRTRHLPLRSISEPWRVHSGCFPSRTTFARASFGREAYSRWSGRTRAFQWPSLVRVGAEAAALAATPAAPDAVTGLSSPINYLWDDRPSRQIWRFVDGGHGAGHGTAGRGTLLSGAVLGLVTDEGCPAGPDTGTAATAKPRFARSSVLMFFASELLLQALTAINAPRPMARGTGPGPALRLARIVVSAPAFLHERERRALGRRLEDAVGIVWRAMGWSERATPMAPQPPSIRLVADTAMSIQAAFLENEIGHKLRNQLGGYFDLMGRTRPGLGTSPSLRVATLDIGDTATVVAVATWEIRGKAELESHVDLSEAFPIAGSDMLKAIAERIVAPAIEQRLTECRVGDARRLMEQILLPSPGQRLPWSADLGRRLAADILMPAALAILRSHERTGQRAGEIHGEDTLAALLASVGASATATADALDSVAADEGASGFSPLETPVSFLHSDIAAIARDVLGPALSSALRAVKLLDCDVVLVAGQSARVPLVMDMLLEGLAMRPDRIVQLDSYRMDSWYPSRDVNGRVGDTKTLAAVGTMLRGAAQPRIGTARLDEQAPDRARRPAFIGRISETGMIERDGMLYAAGEIDGGPTAGDPKRLWRTFNATLPVVFGVRTTSLEQWPARPVWLLDHALPPATPRAKGPLKITIEHEPGPGGGIGMLRLVSAHTIDGNLVDPAHLALRLQTTGFGDGSWIDTGRLSIASTGS